MRSRPGPSSFTFVSKIRSLLARSQSDSMNTQQRLEGVAQQYRRQGYKVTLNPGPADLPDFAKDFKVEILATRPDGSVLVSAKESNRDFESDPALSGYA